jgi:hypothetical protein
VADIIASTGPAQADIWSAALHQIASCFFRYDFDPQIPRRNSSSEKTWVFTSLNPPSTLTSPLRDCRFHKPLGIIKKLPHGL